MAMRWDPPLARAVARELDTLLRGARVRALLLEPGPRRLLLYLRDRTLVAELHPTAGWISLLPPVDPPSHATPLPARVREVRSLPDESALVLGLQRIRGREEGVELVLEFSGNRWNAVVVGHRSRMIRSVLLSGDARGTPRATGVPWTPLPTGGRAGGEGAPPLEREVFEARVAGGRGEVLRGVAGASSLNVEALLAPGGWELLRSLHDPVRWGAWLVPASRGAIVYPLALGKEDAEGVPSLLEGMARLRALSRDGAGAPTPGDLLLPGPLLEAAQGVIGRLRKRARALEREAASSPDPAELRGVGDLLLARFGQVPAGTAEVTLAGFDGEPVTVSLDPALPLHENARRYYDRAARAERAREELPRRLQGVEARIQEVEARLEAARTAVTEGEGGEALRSLEGWLEAHGERVGSGGGEAGRKGRGAGEPGGGRALPFRSYRSSGGLEIRVGRGARHNDDLTFRHAAPDDIWLHVREAPGAHVVLRWGRKENPPARDLAEAATLAALHSEARHAGMVPVDWTRRKHVRKPRKAAPGAVLPQQVQTLFVAPDPAVAERLDPRGGPGGTGSRGPSRGATPP